MPQQRTAQSNNEGGKVFFVALYFFFGRRWCKRANSLEGDSNLHFTANEVNQMGSQIQIVWKLNYGGRTNFGFRWLSFLRLWQLVTHSADCLYETTTCSSQSSQADLHTCGAIGLAKASKCLHVIGRLDREAFVRFCFHRSLLDAVTGGGELVLLLAVSKVHATTYCTVVWLTASSYYVG